MLRETKASCFICPVPAKSVTLVKPESNTSIRLDENDSVKIECMVARALPAAIILWYRGNTTGDNDISGAETTSNISLNTDGTYATRSELTYVGDHVDNGMRIYCGVVDGDNKVTSKLKPLLDIQCKFS